MQIASNQFPIIRQFLGQAIQWNSQHLPHDPAFDPERDEPQQPGERHLEIAILLGAAQKRAKQLRKAMRRQAKAQQKAMKNAQKEHMKRAGN